MIMFSALLLADGIILITLFTHSSISESYKAISNNKRETTEADREANRDNFAISKKSLGKH